MADGVSPNSLVVQSPNGPYGFSLVELKKHLLLYETSPPGPKTVKKVLDLYFDTWGDPFVEYAPTAAGFGSSAWDAGARRHFFEQELPDLRKHVKWGYSFGDGRKSNSWRLMFHG